MELFAPSKRTPKKGSVGSEDDPHTQLSFAECTPKMYRLKSRIRDIFIVYLYASAVSIFVV
jgi:hypothetical protein